MEGFMTDIFANKEEYPVLDKTYEERKETKSVIQFYLIVKDKNVLSLKIFSELWIRTKLSIIKKNIEKSFKNYKY